MLIEKLKFELLGVVLDEDFFSFFKL